MGRRERAQDGRRDTIVTALLCGPVLLVAGLAATAACIFNTPVGDVEYLAAASVAVMGTVFGVAFMSMALPQHWDVPARLWRSLGWLVALAPLPFAFVLLRYPTTAGEHSARIGSRVGAVVTGIAVLATAVGLARLWWRTRHDGTRDEPAA